MKRDKLIKKTKTDIQSELVDAVTKDFEARKLARKPLELQWQLNIDFLNGRQNNHISKFETVATAGKQYYWQESEAFNHIAPMVESRLASLASIIPVIDVVPATNLEVDKTKAILAKKVAESALRKVDMERLTQQANIWSELTGTAFYKVFWDSNGGKLVGKAAEENIFEGDVGVAVCSPFEIYPDNLTASDVSECLSIIHAKAYKTSQIAQIWGVEVQGTDIDIFDLAGTSTRGKNAKSTVSDAAVVIERYEMPSMEHPNGRLITVAGGKLLFSGDLPYVNQSDGRRGLPFVRRCCEMVAGSFFGRSAIERAIPVQRAYNSVKNRKTEFLNRLACGVVSVEEGSVDIDSLESEGLCPGKVIVYRQGTQSPQFMQAGGMPQELEREEARLLAEFNLITGSSGVTANAQVATMSGVALQILVEQENQRNAYKQQSILRSIATVTSQILRLYRQFASAARLDRLVNGTDVEMLFWKKDDLTSDEVIVSPKENEKQI